jgi:hypothetical protein
MTQSLINTFVTLGTLGISIYLALEVYVLRNNMDFFKSKMDDILKEKDGVRHDQKIHKKNPWKKKIL